MLRAWILKVDSSPAAQNNWATRPCTWNPSSEYYVLTQLIIGLVTTIKNWRHKQVILQRYVSLQIMYCFTMYDKD